MKMARYHVGRDGQPRVCKAASPDSCPLAKADGSVVKHFESLPEAQEYGEKVVMGTVSEEPVAGMRDDGRYVDDSGHVYPKMGQEWSDDDRAAYVAQAARDAVDADPESASDDLRSLAAGEWDWDDIQAEREKPTGYGQSPVFEGENIMLDSQWDALDSEYPVITDDVYAVTSNEARSARATRLQEIADKIGSADSSREETRLRNEYTTLSYQNNLLAADDLSSRYGIDDLSGVSDTDREAIWSDVEAGDDALANGNFGEAANRYQSALDSLSEDDRMFSHLGTELEDRADAASIAAGSLLADDD